MIFFFKPFGSGGFPSRPPPNPPRVHLQHLLWDEPRFQSLPEFTLDDFLLDPACCPTFKKMDLKEVTHLRQTYKKLIEKGELHKGNQSKINTQVLSLKSIPVASSRIPQRQVVYELTALMREKMQEHNTEEEAVSPFHSKRQASDRRNAGKCCSRICICSLPLFINKTSIKLYKDQTCSFVFYFRKNGLSFVLSDEKCGIITPAELEILDSLAQGGVLLNLKAHFLSQVPDLTPLANSLLYLNLSFNNLNSLPVEVFNLRYLEVLKLRDNPIKDIPEGIHNLKKLRTFVISFCLISSLPLGLFLLPCLKLLDVSYNKITFIPNDIRNLRALEYLNVEGNELCALPCGALNLPIRQLRISNNYMHALFWEENSQNQPQRLLHLAALIFAQNNLGQHYTDLPSDIQQVLNNVSVCDCCKGMLYGSGLRIIRPCEKIFGINNLPFMFCSCSPSCYKNFRAQTDNLYDILYGGPSS
ncbi:LRC63 protein, partial [Polyodon spathula]|nr:LRC63 protein [Polyodon spathula]